VRPLDRDRPIETGSLVTDPDRAVISPERPQVPETAPDPRIDPRIETERARQERLRTLLNPESVARSSWSIEGEPTARRGPQTGATIDRGETEAEIEARISGDLYATGRTKAHITRTRLVARARPDGTHVYAGHAFTATIQPDGSVDFDDRPGIQTDGVSTSGTFDLGDALMRAQGQDPYAAERERFMEDNAELIERLEDEHRARTRSRGMGALRGRLAQIWQNEERTPEQRKRAIFAMWDEIEESDDGSARDAIEEFIRRELPEGSEHGYTQGEMARLNATRESRERFDPYR
jgi:hypothetical protein